MEHPYRKLMLAIAINSVVMYFVMYSTLYSVEHFHLNINRLYMTMSMVAPMVIVMLFIMDGMFQNKMLNLILHLIFAGIFLLGILLVQTQIFVGNSQFLRSMIPHHSGAILRCKEASITDPDIRAHCVQIVDSQQKQIAEMTQLLQKLE